MQDLWRNKIEQIRKMRQIKICRSMSKEGLLIALLKSKQSHGELYKSKSNNRKIAETKKIFNEKRDKDFQKSVMKGIRKKLYKIEKGLESGNENEKKRHTKELDEAKIKIYHLKIILI